MIKSLLCGKQKNFKEKFLEVANTSSHGKKASLDVTSSAVCVLSKILHRLYKDFLNRDFNEKAARSVATIASIVVLSFERELEVFGVVVDSEQAVLSVSIVILTSIFKRNKEEAGAYCKSGINAYRVVLSNYGKSENVKLYFSDIHKMTINYIDTLDDQYIDTCRQLVIK